MTFMPLRHLPRDLLLRMLWTPHTNFLILVPALDTLISMIRSKFYTRIGMTHLLYHRLDIIIRGMEGSCLGAGIIPQQSSGIILMLLLQNGTIMVAMLIYTIQSSKNFFDSKGHIRHHPHMPCQGNHQIWW